MVYENHDQIIALCTEMAYIRQELQELKDAIREHTAHVDKERKDHSQRIRLVEQHQRVLDTRWKVFAALGSIVSVAGGIVGIVLAFS